MRKRRRGSITEAARRVLERSGQSDESGNQVAPEAAPDTPARRESEEPAGPPSPLKTQLTAQQFEDILERGERILIIESEESETTLRRFESVAHHSGKAVYLWHPEQGLRSLKVNDMGVPASSRMADALRYIVNSKHYGIYAFANFETQLNLTCIQLMQEIANSRTGYDRKVILLGEALRLPANLQKLAARIIHEPERRLRLRDGRWIV